ncbi:MAG: hypothetical protein HQK81_10995 [Desulfovibrionaceae bacterium]|nr:hypothetical protein [Desulfovibrionaceae bacterium]MBF0514568.1 hypothetical protein [Desulfovibrionaceae bacterium]
MSAKVIRSGGDPDGLKRLDAYQAILDRGEGKKVPKSLQDRMNFPPGFDDKGQPFTEEDSERNYRLMFGPKETKKAK